MDAETLCGMMLKAQEQSYGDGLDASASAIPICGSARATIYGSHLL